VNRKTQMRDFQLTRLPAVAACFALVFTYSTQAENVPEPVSFHSGVVPIFKRSCTGCHHPGKLKGNLDLTTYAGLSKGGKHGPSIQAGDPKNSRLIEEISGEEPSMPKEGDPLSKAEVALIAQWIAAGAKDDTPPEVAAFSSKEPPAYSVPPVVSALTYSPDGSTLAVSGYHEVLLHKADGSAITARLVGDSPRIESLAFSSDGKLLAVSGGAPGRFGEIQIWDRASSTLLKSYKISTDSLFGISFSPDAERVAFGCADKTVRMIRVQDGTELLKFDNHSDWVLATTFSSDGKRLLTGSRDRAMKLIDAANGQFIDDINKLLEGVLCLARHPKLDQVVYGGDLGGLRIYRMAENQQRTAANNDVNMLREFERQPGAVRAVAFSPRGDLVAAGGGGPEIRVYKTSDGTRAATLIGHSGAIFALTFHPEKDQIAAGGFDGTVRVYNAISGNLISSFIPVPLTVQQHAAATAQAR
jgi:WD40 repeat protein